MSKNTKNTPSTETVTNEDQLELLAFAPHLRGAFGNLILTIKTQAIRDEFVKVINARASQDSVGALICVIAANVPAEVLASAIRVHSLTNASACGKALAKSFVYPDSGKAQAGGGQASY